MSDSSSFSLAQYASICDSLPDPAFILTASGRYASILGGKDKRYYHDGSSLIGKYLHEVLTPAKTQWFLAQIQGALSSQSMTVVEYELSVHDVLGVPTEGPVEPIWFEGRITALPLPYAGEPAVLWVASNITHTKKLQQQLHQQAMSDDLTGLHNRRSFIGVLEQAYAAFRTQATPACVMYFDVDHFKAINDSLGHAYGDQALQALAQMVVQVMGAEGAVCRLGGDEFAVLCQGASVQTAGALAQQLLQQGRQVLAQYATQQATPSLSLGLAYMQASDHSPQDVMERADVALYASKIQGGHCVNLAPMP